MNTITHPEHLVLKSSLLHRLLHVRPGVIRDSDPRGIRQLISLSMLLLPHWHYSVFLLTVLVVASAPAPAHSASPGSTEVVVAFNPPLRSISTAVLDVKLQPTFLANALLTSPATIQIRLSGAGISCAANATVVFILPFSGLTAVANINAAAPSLPILTISLTGNLTSGYPIWFQISAVSTPTVAQSTVTTLATSIMDRGGNVVASSAAGTMAAIVGDLGSSQPTVVVSGSAMTVTFTPSAALPPQSSLVITFSGATFACDPATPLTSTSTSGAVSCASNPLSSVVVAKLSTLIPAATSVVLSFNLVRDCVLPNAMLAAAVDVAGNVLAASASGSISASGQPSSVHVQHYIRTATAGSIVLPSGVFAGKCNCNNVINETLPARTAGSTVSLQGSPSGTTIDCSGTGTRCLVVYGTSISISLVTFKGGSSPTFVSSNMFAAVRAVLDAVAAMPPMHAPWPTPTHSFVRPSASGSRRLSSLQQPLHQPTPAAYSQASHTNQTHQLSQFQRAQALQQDASIDTDDASVTSVLPAVKALFADDTSAVQFLQLFSHTQRSGLDASNGTNDIFVALAKTLRAMRAGKKGETDALPPAREWDAPSAFDALPQFGARSKRGGSRKLLQLSMTMSAMFSADEAQCGGCLLVIHSEGFASLTDVNLIACSAVYGGGGFFNVSEFFGAGGSAQDNRARQGGGLFLAATKESNLSSFSFLRNTVATSSTSEFTNQDGGTFGVFAHMPDAAAAAGAGAWVQSLGSSRNCTFVENVAMAATTFTRSPQKVGASAGGFFQVSSNIVALLGSHALGSGLFVLKMQPHSILSEMNFIGCKSLCAGWCVSAGTLFVGDVGGGSVLTQLSFDACESSALASAAMSAACGQMQNDGCGRIGPSLAMAAGIFIRDIPVSTLWSSISAVRVTSCIVQAVGGAVGAAMMLQSIKNVEISSISFEKITVLVSGYESLWSRISGLLTSDNADQVKIWDVSSTDTVLNCDGCPVGTVRGGLLYLHQCTSTVISSIRTQNLLMTCNGRGGYCNLEGGVIYSDYVHPDVAISNTTARHVSLDCKGSRCNSLGGVMYFDRALMGAVISLTSAYNVSLQCTSFDESGALADQPCLAGGGVLHLHMGSKHVIINRTTAVLLSVVCKGKGCAAMAGVLYVGLGWYLQIENLRVSDVNVYSVGKGSAAVAATVSILAGRQCTVSDLQYENGTVLASGIQSAAFGGSIAVFAGSVTVAQSNFSNSVVSCIGDMCSSLGGYFAIVSSIQLNPAESLSDDNKWDHNSAVIRASSLHGAAVSCSGQGCFASGGALFAGVAYRGIEGPFTRNMGCPTCLAPEMSNVTIERCSVTNNSVSSASPNATASGAAISLFPSVALMSNTVIFGNTLNTSALGAFVGGAGVYAASEGTVATLIDSRVSNNDASSSGSGGGIFVGPEAVFSCRNVSIEDNSAGKGGGVHIDGAHVSLSSALVLNNRAATTGGGLFCVSKLQGEMSNNSLVLKGSSVIVLQQTVLLGNVLLDASETVGAAVYIYGAVRVEADSASNVFMNGGYNITVTEAVMSVNELSNIQLATICRSGTVLNVAYTGVQNQRSQLIQPTADDMQNSQCYPACLSTPKFTPYTAASGFLATCIPCPKPTYSFSNSSNSTDSIASFCAPCPFGAECRGGSKVVSRQGYWGWMASETQLAAQFLSLPEGYGCEGDECEAIDTCGHNHTGVLCGSCNQGFSAAYFTTECVSDDECSDTKLAVLVCASFIYAFVFSIFLRYEAEAQEEDEEEAKDEPHALDADDEAAEHHGSDKSDAVSDIEEVKELRENSFLVLMWYYQLTGLLLTMPNPMALFDSGAFFTSILGLVFGTMPVSQAIELPNLVFCTKAGSTHLDVLIGNLLFYAMWAIMMIVLTFKRAWLPVFRVVQSFSEATAGFWDNYDAACEALEAWGNLGKMLAVFVALQWTLQTALAGITLATMAAAVRGIFNLSCAKVLSFFRAVAAGIVLIVTCGMCCRKHNDEQVDAKKKPRAQPAEVRGKAWLDWGISAYSAILSLLVQCTTCVNVEGFQSDTASSVIRWFYDGRVVCFSDSGEQPGFWQFWALGGVIFMALVPLVLAIYMHIAMKKSEGDQNVFDRSALPYYAGQFASGSKHWFATM